MTRPGARFLLPALLLILAAAGGPAASGLPLSASGDAEREALERKIVAGPGLSDLSAYAYLSSPMVKAARARWRSTVEQYRVDTAWANPEVMFEGMYMTETFGDRERPDDWNIRLTQGIPLPGRLGKAGDVSKAESRIARIRLDAAVRDTVVAIRESYHELLYLRDAKRVAAQNRELLDRLRKAGEGAYAANRAALFDVMKAQAQSGQLLYDALLLDELEKTGKVRLNALLDRPADAAIGPLSEIPVLPVVFDLPGIQAAAEANYEENRVAQAGVEKAQSMVSLTRYENIPEFNVGFSRGKLNGNDQVGFQVGMALPIWRGKNSGRLGAARADLETMESMRKAQQNETRTMVSDTYFRLQNAGRLVVLYRDDLLPQALRAIEGAETVYRQRQGSFSDYLEAQSAFYNFQLSLARAKADYGKWLARLEKLAGKKLTEADGAPASPAVKDEFDAEVLKLREASARWENALETATPEAAFLAPDPARKDRLKDAATDNTAAGNALGDGFSLHDLETLALLRNPRVASKEHEFRAVLEGYGQVENLDTILRRYSAFASSLMTGVGAMESPEAMAASKFPFPGVLALKGQVVSMDAAAARERLEAARRDAVTSVRKALRELVYVQSARETASLVIDLLDGFNSAVSARYSAGAGTFQDVLKVGVAREKAREELRTLDEARKNAEALLREGLALPPSIRIGFPAADNLATPLPAIGGLEAMASEWRQELRAMRAEIGKMERMLAMQETMINPGFSLNLSRYDRDEISRVGAGAMGEAKEAFPSSTASFVGEGLPKAPAYGTQAAWLRELRERIEAAKSDLRMEEAATLLGVRNAWFELDKAKREEALYGERVVVLSRSALETSSRGYSAGKVPFADLIESYRGWFEANLALARSRADIGVAWASLDAAVGKSISSGGTK